MSHQNTDIFQAMAPSELAREAAHASTAARTQRARGRRRVLALVPLWSARSSTEGENSWDSSDSCWHNGTKWDPVLEEKSRTT